MLRLTARYTLRRRGRMRPIGPFDRRTGLGEVEREEMFGYGVTIYIVLFATIGAASCP